jgi:hypothetical protein
MTHEPIHTVHLTPHITWQGTRAELEAMQKLRAGRWVGLILTALLNWSATSWRQKGVSNGWQDGLILVTMN